MREVEERYKRAARQRARRALRDHHRGLGPGASLGTVLDLADAEIGQTSPGDFVRNAKQVADLCEQLARMSDLTSRRRRGRSRPATRSCAASWRAIRASTRAPRFRL